MPAATERVRISGGLSERASERGRGVEEGRTGRTTDYLFNLWDCDAFCLWGIYLYVHTENMGEGREREAWGADDDGQSRLVKRRNGIGCEDGIGIGIGIGMEWNGME